MWRKRLAGVGAIGGALLAATIEASIDDAAVTARDSILVWSEALLAKDDEALPAAQVAGWIDDRRQHWLNLLHGRHPDAEMLSCVIADYIIAEELYSAALSADTDYRLIRAACVARLCRVPDVGGGWDGWERLLPAAWRELRHPLQKPAPGVRAAGVAEAAARLILERGPAGVTHRSVASLMGRSSSAVAHHFGRRVDLVEAGFDSLFRGLRSTLQGPGVDDQGEETREPTVGSLSSTAVGFVRAMHIIALVAARDPAFRPLMLEERAARGRLIEAWYGEPLIGSHRTDRLFLQIVSLVTGIRTLRSSLDGALSPDGNRQALAEVLAALG